MEKKRDIENNGFMPQKGNPLHETVTYKIGGTIFEVSTICGGSELLYDKMKRLIKSETVKTPTDKEKEVRYNEDMGTSCFITRSKHCPYGNIMFYNSVKTLLLWEPHAL